TGACTENDDCTSGICGVNGQGFCCTNACSTNDKICGAFGCDPTGACSYNPNTQSCGPPQVCFGSTQVDAFLCDGMGNCPAPPTVNCAPYVCGTTQPPACLTVCQDKTSCIAGAFCDAVGSACCPLASGGFVSVDAVTGNDDAGCCGVGTNPP